MEDFEHPPTPGRQEGRPTQEKDKVIEQARFARRALLERVIERVQNTKADGATLSKAKQLKTLYD